MLGLSADIVLFNGKIVTVDDRDSIVEAVAIRDGRFVAVGGADEVMALSGDSTKVIDLKGKTAMPGIIDSHTHPGGIASRFLEVDCRAPPVRNIKEILGRHHDRHDRRQECPSAG